MLTVILAGGLYVDVGWATATIVLFVLLTFLLASVVILEFINIHLPYSKFATEDELKQNPLQMIFGKRVSSKAGFFILYFLPFISY